MERGGLHLCRRQMQGSAVAYGGLVSYLRHPSRDQEVYLVSTCVPESRSDSHGQTEHKADSKVLELEMFFDDSPFDDSF